MKINKNTFILKKVKILNIYLLILFIGLYSCGDSKTDSTVLSKTSFANSVWESEEQGIILKFLDDSMVVRYNPDGYEIQSRYLIKDNFVIIRDGLVHIPLIYKNGTLKGKLVFGQGQALLKRQNYIIGEIGDINSNQSNENFIGDIEVMKNDLYGTLYLSDAIDSAKRIGNGWRVPNMAELKIIYENRDKIGGFNTNSKENITTYLSSEELNDSKQSRSVYLMDFSNGKKNWDFYDGGLGSKVGKGYTYGRRGLRHKVRLVRSNN